MAILGSVIPVRATRHQREGACPARIKGVKRLRQIIAIGGGGFSNWGAYSEDNFLIERYFLHQTGKELPSVCFLPTASADDAAYTVNFYRAFTKHQCKPTHLSLFSPCTADLESFLLDKDAIYVGGGNTKNLLALWREWGVDKILRKAWHKGVVLGGISAGMNCWFEECVTDSLFGNLSALKSLGFLKGSACPHYNGEKKRRPAYHELLLSGKLSPGIAVDDHAAVHYVDGEIQRVITAQETGAYHVFVEGEKAVEKALLAEKLD